MDPLHLHGCSKVYYDGILSSSRQILHSLAIELKRSVS